MKKTLMIATAALALTAGAATLSSPANAGASFHLNIGGYGHGYGSYYGGYNSYYGGCYTKYKKVRIKVYDYYGWHWEWIVKPYRVCY